MMITVCSGTCILQNMKIFKLSKKEYVTPMEDIWTAKAVLKSDINTEHPK